MSILRAFILVATAAFVCGTSAFDARAEDAPPSDPDSAEALFQSALGALDQGDWEAACPKFELSMKLDPTVATLLNIAKCRAHDGKVALAWRTTAEAILMNRSTADPVRREKLESYARSQLAQLESRLAWLVLRVSPTLPPGAIVERDGEVIPPSSLGEAIPVDPGEHTLRVVAEGYEEHCSVALTTEGKTATVEIALVPIAPIPILTKSTSDAPRDVGPLAGGVVVGTLGLLGLAVGTVAGVRALDFASALERRCPEPSRCDATGVDLADKGKTASLVSTTAFVVGGVLAAAAVPLTIWGASKLDADNKVNTGLVLGFGYIGLRGEL
ncbi:MAG: hypothetical protein U0271_43805 [Polyangiaceae bacterium]